MLNLIACPVCSGTFIPDSTLTISEYGKDYKEKYHVAVLEEIPPELFNYMVFKCQNRECGVVKKYLYSEVLTLITERWSKLAWIAWAQDMKKGVSFENYFTRYLVDNKLDLKVEEIQKFNNNEFIKDFLKYGKFS